MSPFPRGKMKSSAAPHREFGMGRDGTATLRVSPVSSGAVEQSSSNAAIFRASETNGQGQCRQIHATAFPSFGYTHVSSEEKHDPWLKKKLRAEKPPGTSTTRLQLKFWADWKRSANAPRCISVPRARWDCTIWCGKSLIIRSTKQWRISPTKST